MRYRCNITLRPPLLYIFDANDKFVMQDSSLLTHSVLDQRSSPIFVRKGMKVAFDDANASATYSNYTHIMFVPLVS